MHAAWWISIQMHLNCEYVLPCTVSPADEVAGHVINAIMAGKDVGDDLGDAHSLHDTLKKIERTGSASKLLSPIPCGRRFVKDFDKLPHFLITDLRNSQKAVWSQCQRDMAQVSIPHFFCKQSYGFSVAARSTHSISITGMLL